MQHRRLADVTNCISRGISPAYDEQGITVFNQKCIRKNVVNSSEARINNPEKRRVSPEKLLRQHDVLVNSTGVGTLGRLAQIRNVPGLSTVDSHITIVRPDLCVFDGSYFGYAMVWNEPLITAMGEGATGQTELSRTRLGEEIQVPVPPLSTQRKIASILSAYDDLIENNTRRIQILEEMAQAIYREWFVNFRFPGHEKAGMVESELGPIPEGWQVQQFSEVADLSRSGINPSRFDEETFAHFSIPAFDESKMPKREMGVTIRSNKHLVPDECVLLSKINPRIPRVWLPFPETDIRAITSTEFLVLIPKSRPTSVYLFGLCHSAEFLEAFAGRALGTSTSHQRVKPKDLQSMVLAIPSQSLIESYSQIARPILRLAHALRQKNANLRHTRDLLLPKLISGEVDVAELDFGPESIWGSLV